MVNKLKKSVSCLSAAAMLASMAFSAHAAGTLDISNGADIAGYAINGAKVKMSATNTPENTAKIKWYIGLDNKSKTLIREIDGSEDTFWADLQSEKMYIFAEALDADGNVLAANDRSMQYGTNLNTVENIFSVNFDEGYGWYGHQTIIDKNQNYIRSSTQGKIGVSYGAPTTVPDPAGINGTCMKLEDGDFNYIEAANNSTKYEYTLDRSSIYVLESDMMFEDLSDRKLTKVTYQDSNQAAEGNKEDGRDSVAVNLSDGNFEFYGNTIPAETNKWYNVKYVYDAINSQLTALVDNKYLGLAAGVDMAVWGRLSFVENRTTMYLDNIKLTRFVPSATITKEGSNLIADSGASVWRSLDGIIYKKVSDDPEFTFEELPYPQYFVSRIYDGDEFTQSQAVIVNAAYQRTEKKTYFDYDFSSSDLSDYDFTYSDKSKFSVNNDKLVIAPTASAIYQLTTSTGDLKGLDGGVIYVEADISLNDWRNNNIFRLCYLRDLSSWSNSDDVYVECAGGDYGTGGTLFIWYTDTDGNKQKIDTGISYSETVHYKAAVDVDSNTITLTMNNKEFKLDKLRNIRFLYSVTFGSYGNTTATVDNTKCYKYENKDIDIKFGFSEKSYLCASDRNNNISSGMSIVTVITNDSDTKSFVSYAAAYDENGRLAEVVKSNTTISGDYIIKNFKFTNEYPDNRIKLFSWNNKLSPVLPVE